MALVNWDLAKKIASQISKRIPEPMVYDSRAMEAMFDELTPKAEELVKQTTGLISSTGTHISSARSRVLSREDWIEANLKTFSRMLRPLEKRLEDKLNKVSYNLGGVQVGLLLGWMSTRVLGQYDLLILEDENPEAQDLVYYVGPNVATIEWRFGFEPEDFRLWIALHELTHRAQFTGIPWLREHFLSLVEQSLENVDLDMDRIKTTLANLKERSKQDKSLPYLISSPEQIELFNELGGMMSLLEGHGEVMMDQAAKGHVEEVERFHRVMRLRRTQNKGLSGILQKLLGIETKLRQYEAGEKFIHQLLDEGGDDLLSVAWSSPENLPSMDEIHEPSTWIERVKSNSYADIPS